MRYRKFGRTNEKISILSLGCMRFPDENSAVEMVEKSVELGINYFESAEDYCQGNSERWLAQGLGKNRAEVMVSTKSNCGGYYEGDAIVTSDEVRNHIEKSLTNLQTHWIDFYHCWFINTEHAYRACIQKGGWYEGVQKTRDEGLVKYIGITTHAPPNVVMMMVEDGLVDVITVQYSLILRSYREIVTAASEKQIGIVIMGPLAGGLLATQSKVLQRVFSPLDQVTGALRYVLCDPGVSSVASGMTSVEEVEENCEIVNALPENLSLDFQKKVDARIREELGSGIVTFESLLCGGCRYCLSVCPERIGPHNIFKAYNVVMLKGKPSNPKEIYTKAVEFLEKCTDCGECEKICPQSIRVPEHLERVRDYFATIRM